MGELPILKFISSLINIGCLKIFPAKSCLVPMLFSSRYSIIFCFEYFSFSFTVIKYPNHDGLHPVQILGRIRRNSSDVRLNTHKRVFFVNSGRIPSNLGHRHPYEKIEIKYDLEYEKKIFEKENYIKVNNDQITNQ